MSTHIIHVFISHSWSYSGHYEKLSNWIFSQGSSKFKNYSVPRDDPIHNARSDRELSQRIDNQIARCHVVVAPMGMYASRRHSKWIGKELRLAKKRSKPILAVNPWGQKRRPSIVREAADTEVGWNRASVVRAIRELCRQNN